MTDGRCENRQRNEGEKAPEQHALGRFDIFTSISGSCLRRVYHSRDEGQAVVLRAACGRFLIGVET